MTELLIIGLMSGTSADGIDATVLKTDGQTMTRTGYSGHFPYSEDTRAAIRACFLDPAKFLFEPSPRLSLETVIASEHAAAAQALFKTFGTQIDLIGFHGQTVYHNPHSDSEHPLGRQTIQLGDAKHLARITGVNVVHNVRAADMDAGGQGAPLAPVYHSAVVSAMRTNMPVVFVNIGGVANLTYVAGDDPAGLIGFDTGPGNGLIDDFMMAKFGASCDFDGVLAATGKVDDALIAGWMEHPYLAKNWPKSLDRQEFAELLMQRGFIRLAAADAAATLTRFTAKTIAHAIHRLPLKPRLVLVAGGGRRNPCMMRHLASCLPMPLKTEKSGSYDADMLEAELMAFLAARHHFGLPTSFPGTTGCEKPICGGQLALAK